MAQVCCCIHVTKADGYKPIVPVGLLLNAESLEFASCDNCVACGSVFALRALQEVRGTTRIEVRVCLASLCSWSLSQPAV